MNSAAITAENARHGWTFGPMVAHVGKALQDLLDATGIKRQRLLSAVAYSESQMHRHFNSEDLSTGVLRRYERAFRTLGIEVDICGLLVAQKRDANRVEDPQVLLRRLPPVVDLNQPSISDAAVMLRQAALTLERLAQQQKGGGIPAPERDDQQG